MGKHQRTGKVFLLLLSVFFLSLISATVTLNVPASSATVIGGNTTHAVWNATSDGGSSFHGILNCTIFGKSVALTANTTYVNLNVTTNSSLNQSSFQAVFNSSSLEDGTDYSFYTSCRNNTGTLNSSANTAIIINNQIPDAPSSLTPADNTIKTSSGAVTFSSTVNNAETTSCTYVINRAKSSSDSKSASGTGTYSASTCSFAKTFSGTNDNGIYYWTITASDGTDTTASSEGIYNVQLPGAGGGIPQGSQGSKSNKTLIIVLVIIGLVLLLNKGKK